VGAGRRAVRAVLERHGRGVSQRQDRGSSLAAPLYISAFRQEDGSYNVVWSRPTRRRDLAAEMAPKADEGLPPLPGADETAGPATQGTEAGLGQSSAEHAFAS
jgi:hypothetical protein